jgi:hypothetical protein
VPAAASCWLWSEAKLRGSAVPSGSLGPRQSPLTPGPSRAAGRREKAVPPGFKTDTLPTTLAARLGDQRRFDELFVERHAQAGAVQDADRSADGLNFFDRQFVT